MAKNKENLLSVMLDLEKKIGEEALVLGLNECGWVSLTFSPVAYFQGYLGALNWREQKERLEIIYRDVESVANLYGFDIDGYNLIDIVPN